MNLKCWFLLTIVTEECICKCVCVSFSEVSLKDIKPKHIYNLILSKSVYYCMNW